LSGVDVEAELASPLVPDGVVTDDARDATPALGPGSASNDVRSVGVDRVEGAIALFNRDRSREAVAAGVGVGDLMRVERAVGDQVVFDDAASIAGQGREQRVGLTDAEAAEFDEGVVDGEAGSGRRPAVVAKITVHAVNVNLA